MSRTYIPCVLTSSSARRVKELINARTARSFGKVTKAAVREGVRVSEATGKPLEFQSTSIYHRAGAYFSIGEAIKVYGPEVGLEVRDEGGYMVAMIEADPTKVVVR